jgi:hypothetical protein
MRIRVPLALALLTVVLAGWIAAGCSDDSTPRSVLQITDINKNQPLSSDVAEGPDSALTVREDAIVITVKNTPHDTVLDLSSEQAFSLVTLDRYEIRFESSESIPTVSGALGWTVRSGSSVDGSLVVVPASLKVQAPLISLRDGGEIQTTARLTIIGHEATSNSTIKVVTSFPVNFANWTDQH